jgi:hypothetical protein
MFAADSHDSNPSLKVLHLSAYGLSMAFFRDRNAFRYIFTFDDAQNPRMYSLPDAIDRRVGYFLLEIERDYSLQLAQGRLFLT